MTIQKGARVRMIFAVKTDEDYQEGTVVSINGEGAAVRWDNANVCYHESAALTEVTSLMAPQETLAKLREIAEYVQSKVDDGLHDDPLYDHTEQAEEMAELILSLPPMHEPDEEE